MDYYEILQLSEGATHEELKKSYQQLALIHHPDKSKDPSSSEKFSKIDTAYKTLKDPTTRKEYDSKRHQQSAKCHMIIHDIVRRSEFQFDETNDVHFFVCKCGGWYILDMEISDAEYIICCNECSLVIKVLN